jgi:hypothetical protein
MSPRVTPAPAQEPWLATNNIICCRDRRHYAAGRVRPGLAGNRRRCGYRVVAVDLYGALSRSEPGEAGMAQKITVALEDDLDGGPADETVRFGLSGAEYEIDLSKKNAAAFRKQLAPFIEHARKAGRGQGRRPGRTASSRERSGGIRAWAKDQGIAVSARGRIPASVVEQYEAATKGS